MRPKKLKGPITESYMDYGDWASGYNKAIDEYEKHLPHKEEVFELISSVENQYIEYIKEKYRDEYGGLPAELRNRLTEVIHKRIYE